MSVIRLSSPIACSPANHAPLAAASMARGYAPVCEISAVHLVVGRLSSPASAHTRNTHTTYPVRQAAPRQQRLLVGYQEEVCQSRLPTQAQSAQSAKSSRSQCAREGRKENKRDSLSTQRPSGDQIPGAKCPPGPSHSTSHTKHLFHAARLLHISLRLKASSGTILQTRSANHKQTWESGFPSVVIA